MTNGAVFRIIANDGNQDKILTANGILQRRLKRVENARMNDPSYSDDPSPTLLDVTKTHTFHMHATFKPFVASAYEYAKISSQSGTSSLGSKITFSIPQFGDFFSDCALYVKLTAPRFSKASGSDTELPSARWAALPGGRLIQKADFTVNGNQLDEYTQDTYAFYNHFLVGPEKRAGWNRCMGQENPRESYLTPSAAATTVDNHRVRMDVAEGHQTLKGDNSVGDLIMTIPLLFWFALDVKRAMPSIAIPYGQRFINLELATQAQMCYFHGRGNSDGAPVVDTAVTVSEIYMYINNIFVIPAVHDIFVRRIGFYLVRVHRTQKTTLTASSGSIHLNNMKWPLESMFVGVRILDYQTTAADNDKWHEFYSNNSYSNANRYNITGVAGNDNADATAGTQPYTHAFLPVRTLATMVIKAHGVDLYKSMPAQMYDSYFPTVHSPGCMSAPSIEGPMFVNFALHAYNRAGDPSGHLNVSRAREFYLDYVSNTYSDSTNVIGSVSGNTKNGQLVIDACALNFLLVTDGSAVMRYST